MPPNNQQPTTTNQKDEVLIRAENVGKKFCRSLKKSLIYGVQDVGYDLMGVNRSESGLRKGEFWANQGISFELRRGECLGLIGKNGAGKTTLLKMLNGLIKPDQGSITMHGKVGALIALGAGFNPILTGRENIYINGSVLGLSKREIDIRMEEIIDFAEIPDFIDTPVQNYSSGMQVRLGFAVATSLNPDVLLIDEVLAVGDVSFRNKCYKRIADLRENAAIILVTHQMGNITRTCDSTLVLKNGSTEFLGDVENGVIEYEKVNNKLDDQKESFLSLHDSIKYFSYSPIKEYIQQGEKFSLQVELESSDIYADFTFRLLMYGDGGDLSLGTDVSNIDHSVKIKKGFNKWVITVPDLCLKRGRYGIAINLISPKGYILVWSYKEKYLEIKSKYGGPSSKYQPIISKWIEI